MKNLLYITVALALIAQSFYVLHLKNTIQSQANYYENELCPNMAINNKEYMQEQLKNIYWDLQTKQPGQYCGLFEDGSYKQCTNYNQ